MLCRYRCELRDFKLHSVSNGAVHTIFIIISTFYIYNNDLFAQTLEFCKQPPKNIAMQSFHTNLGARYTKQCSIIMIEGVYVYLKKRENSPDNRGRIVMFVLFKRPNVTLASNQI